jgi:cytochrome c-type biogenesis protein CcmF
MLQAWNFILVIGAFSLTIFGTFLTRSGTVDSVHSFTQSAIGPALLGFLVLVLVGSFTLFSWRSHLVASTPRIENLVSREGTFLANNLILSLYAFVVLIGTTYPLLLEAFTGTRVGVGGPFFNRLAVPLSFLLLLVMGLGPVTPWVSAPKGQIWLRTRAPTLIALTSGLATALLVTRVGWVVLAVILGVFVVAAIGGVLLELTTKRATTRDEGRWEAAKKVVGGDQPFWAGQLSHLGVVLVALGIAFAANLGEHREVDMEPGQTVEFSGYAITYRAPFLQQEPGKVTRGARLEVTKGETVIFMEPAANYFGADTTGVSTPAVLTRPGGDLYVTLLVLTPETATLTFDTSPMIWLLWIGGLTTAAGGFWAVGARRRERVTAPPRQTADV